MVVATSVWFVTPAWRRFALSAVCFDQRLDVMRQLTAAGVEAHTVVIADDANVELAQERGFEVVERDNRWLGRRFNDGIEYARDHGATWIVPIGSDSFIDPAYLLPLPDQSVARTSPLYCHARWNALSELSVGVPMGAGPFMFHRDLLASTGGRPAVDKLARGCDTSTVRGIEHANGEPVHWEQRNLHPFQYIGFRGWPAITSYRRVLERWGQREHRDPAAILSAHYPPDLVERALAALPRPGDQITRTRRGIAGFKSAPA